MREQILSVLAVHRAATTTQLNQLLTPSPDTYHLRHCLRDLHSKGLVHSQARAHHPNIWSLTGPGLQTVLTWPQFQGRRPYRAGAAISAMRSSHTLTVTRTALAFLNDAHARGDEFGAMDWMTEVAHPIRDGSAGGERALIADALLRYTRTSPTRALLRAFVEVDRATESSERLASKVITYARFHSHVPVAGRREAGGDPTGLRPWQRSYAVFPRLLFVLTGAGPRALAQRVADLRAMVCEHPLTEQFAEEVAVGAAVLEEMEERGPSAAVWWPLDGRPGRCSWMEL
ncbi:MULTISPECIES: replication-relaxation family protein [Streptomyces]|uniref:replication-relaxation family protein n=1 Tax=Streptomyces TaxID=1883 RepID=UPI001314AECD|nr:replication-relaxation family protein [Streptomyces sp. MOE7]